MVPTRRLIKKMLSNSFVLFPLSFTFILLHKKFLRFDWIRAVVFQLNLKYPTCAKYKTFEGRSINICVIFSINTTRDISNLIVSNFTRLTVRKISYNNFEISLVVSSLCQISLQIMQIRFELVIEV